MDKYIGKVVQLIYIDRYRNVTIRDLQVISVKGGKIKGYCHSAQSIRIFNQYNIVDMEVIKRHA